MKINQTRTVTSLQPDRRNGHRPAVTAQFWGDQSAANRHTSKGPGKKLEVSAPVVKPWWEMTVPEPECNLKNWKPKIKVEAKPKKEKTLNDLIRQFNKRRSK